MKIETAEILYNWVTSNGMNAPAECLELLNDPISINRELEAALSTKAASAFNGCAPLECMETLQCEVRKRLEQEAEQLEFNAQYMAECEHFRATEQY